MSIVFQTLNITQAKLANMRENTEIRGKIINYMNVRKNTGIEGKLIYYINLQ